MHFSLRGLRRWMMSFIWPKSQAFRSASYSGIENGTFVFKQKCFVLQKGHTGVSSLTHMVFIFRMTVAEIKLL